MDVNPVQDLLVRILIGGVLPTGIGRCRACTEPVVAGVEELLSHYTERHLGLVISTLAVAVVGIGMASVGTYRRSRD